SGRGQGVAEGRTSTVRDGPGWLAIARPDGTRRRIQVIYQEGFEGRGEQGYSIRSDVAVLTLYCPDPYWIDPVPVTTQRSHSTGVDFLDPLPDRKSVV